jgi:hypothetical protein
MNPALRSSHRLVKRGAAGLACDEDGVALGSVSLISARKIAGGGRLCSVRSPDEIGAILRTGYGPQPAELVSRLHRGLCRTAAWIEAGDIGRAGVEALMLGLPDLTSEAMAKLDRIADLEKGNAAWQTETRVPAGQAGGGQWTTGSGPAATAGAKPVQTTMARRPQLAPQLQPSPISPCGPVSGAPSVSTSEGRNDWQNLLVHVNTAAIPADGYGVAQDFELPASIARLGQLGLLAYAAKLLDDADAAAAREQISNAIKRFGLDPSRPADVIAASAYVWSHYQLPAIPEVPASGPGLEAASQAVMRFVMIHPGAFTSMSRDSVSLITAAALGGLSDLNLESSARPQGVDPALQTRSERARAAIAIHLLSGAWQAHHLVPIMATGRYAYIFNLAIKDGWKTDLATNLIALPADENSQLSVDEILPLHRTNHPNYNNDTLARILAERSTYPAELTSVDAYAIIQDVANFNRARILAGYYNPVMKVGP